MKTKGKVVKSSGDKRTIEQLKSLTYKASNDTIGRGTYQKYGDTMVGFMGPITQSHPEEIDKMLKRAEELGVKVYFDSPEKLGYSISRPGIPGEIYLSKESSYCAWKHEFRHMEDDARDGFPGWMAFCGDTERTIRMEKDAYQEEIDIAVKYGLITKQKNLQSYAMLQLIAYGENLKEVNSVQNLKEEWQKYTDNDLVDKLKEKSPLTLILAITEVYNRKIRTKKAIDGIESLIIENDYILPFGFSVSDIAQAALIELGAENTETKDQKVVKACEILRSGI